MKLITQLACAEVNNEFSFKLTHRLCRYCMNRHTNTFLLYSHWLSNITWSRSMGRSFICDLSQKIGNVQDVFTKRHVCFVPPDTSRSAPENLLPFQRYIRIKSLVNQLWRHYSNSATLMQPRHTQVESADLFMKKPNVEVETSFENEWSTVIESRGTRQSHIPVQTHI